MSAVLTPPSAVAQRALPEIRYRPLTENDLPRVVAIESMVYAFPWSFGNFRDSLFSGYYCTGAFVGEAANELIGYTIVMPALEEQHILNLAVSAAWQGRGAGAAMLAHLVAEARRTPCEVMYLEVRPSNVAALRLYDRFGFRELGRRRDYYPAVTGREDALFLGLNIRAPLVVDGVQAQ
jgi:[ribosomal protein S18]-alanine N-acetyltransferase